MENSCFIVSNDRFRDFIRDKSLKDNKRKDKLQKWVNNHTINFAFINFKFIPNPDFMFKFKI